MVRTARTLKASFSDGSGSKLPSTRGAKVQEEILNDWICLEAVPSRNIAKYINEGDVAVLGSRLILHKSLVLSDRDSKSGLGILKTDGLFQSFKLYKSRLDVLKQSVDYPPAGCVQLYIIKSKDGTCDLRINKLFKDKLQQEVGPSLDTEVVAFSELRFAALGKHISSPDMFTQGSEAFHVALLRTSIVDLLNQENFYSTSVNGILPHWKLVFRDVGSRDKFLGDLTDGTAKLEFVRGESLSFLGLVSGKRKELERELEDSEQQTKRVREVLDKVKELEELVQK